MTTPSVRAQLRAMNGLPTGQAGLPTGQAGLPTGQAGLPTGQAGTARPHPRKADRVREKTHKQRLAIGAPVKAMVQWEEMHYPTFEALLAKHGCTFFHPTTNHLTRRRVGQKGWVDYVILGLGWHAFCELKAVNQDTGRKGKLDTDQQRYRDEIIEAGGEYRSFLLPDEWPAVEDWLTSHSGKTIRGTWRTA